jgi:hypothetical protein
MKCAAELPSCSRCLRDDRSCFYKKSRRGLRDKSGANAAAQLDTPAIGQISDNYQLNDFYNYERQIGNSSIDSHTLLTSVSSEDPSSPASSTLNRIRAPISTNSLLDLCYK